MAFQKFLPAHFCSFVVDLGSGFSHDLKYFLQILLVFVIIKMALREGKWVKSG